MDQKTTRNGTGNGRKNWRDRLGIKKDLPRLADDFQPGAGRPGDWNKPAGQPPRLNVPAGTARPNPPARATPAATGTPPKPRSERPAAQPPVARPASAEARPRPGAVVKPAPMAPRRPPQPAPASRPAGPPAAAAAARPAGPVANGKPEMTPADEFGARLRAQREAAEQVARQRLAEGRAGGFARPATPGGNSPDVRKPPEAPAGPAPRFTFAEEEITSARQDQPAGRPAARRETYGSSALNGDAGYDPGPRGPAGPAGARDPQAKDPQRGAVPPAAPAIPGRPGDYGAAGGAPAGGQAQGARYERIAPYQPPARGPVAQPQDNYVEEAPAARLGAYQGGNQDYPPREPYRGAHSRELEQTARGYDDVFEDEHRPRRPAARPQRARVDDYTAAYNEFEDNYDDEPRRGKGVWLLIMALLVIAGIAFGVAYFYTRNLKPQPATRGNVPTITAPPAPAKTVPDQKTPAPAASQPKGRKKIYDRILGDGQTTEPDRITPTLEPPATRPAPAIPVPPAAATPPASGGVEPLPLPLPPAGTQGAVPPAGDGKTNKVALAAPSAGLAPSGKSSRVPMPAPSVSPASSRNIVQNGNGSGTTVITSQLPVPGTPAPAAPLSPPPALTAPATPPAMPPAGATAGLPVPPGQPATTAIRKAAPPAAAAPSPVIAKPAKPAKPVTAVRKTVTRKPTPQAKPRVTPPRRVVNTPAPVPPARVARPVQRQRALTGAGPVLLTPGQNPVTAATPPAASQPSLFGNNNTAAVAPVTPKPASSRRRRVFGRAGDDEPVSSRAFNAPAVPAAPAATRQRVAALPQPARPVARATPAQPVRRAAPAPRTASTASGYVVQLASFRSRTEALSAYQRMASRHPGLLRGKNAQITQANLGAAGTFYRMGVGPITSRTAARRLCNSLISAGEKDCLVRRR